MSLVFVSKFDARNVAALALKLEPAALSGAQSVKLDKRAFTAVAAKFRIKSPWMSTYRTDSPLTKASSLFKPRSTHAQLACEPACTTCLSISQQQGISDVQMFRLLPGAHGVLKPGTK